MTVTVITVSVVFNGFSLSSLSLFAQVLEAACIRNVPVSSSASSHQSRRQERQQEVELRRVPA